MNEVFFLNIFWYYFTKVEETVWFFFHFIPGDCQEQKFVTKVVKAVLKMSGIPALKKSEDDETAATSKLGARLT